MEIDTTTYYQTGDVLYFKVKGKPKGLKKVETNLIHQGRDNKHTISGDYSIYVNNDVMLINVKSTATLKHGEHTDIIIKKGTYLKRIVQERDHFLELTRAVID
jgi:hypothetical protein